MHDNHPTQAGSSGSGHNKTDRITPEEEGEVVTMKIGKYGVRAGETQTTQSSCHVSMTRVAVGARDKLFYANFS